MGGGYAPFAGRVDIGGWLGQAWTLFSARSGVWIGAFALYLLIGITLWVLWAIPTGVLETMRQAYLAIISHTVPPVQTQNPFLEFAKNRVFTLVLAGVNAIFFGGLYKMALRQARGEAISVAGLFSGFPQALPLLMVAVALSGAVALLEGACVGLLHLAHLSPSLSVSLSSLLTLLPALVIQGLLMFAPLLIIDQNAGAGEAIQGSLRLVRGQGVMAVLAYFVLGLIGGLGAMVCGFGMLVTYPLFLISIAVGYLAFTQPPPPVAFPQYDPYTPPQAGVWPPPPSRPPTD